MNTVANVQQGRADPQSADGVVTVRTAQPGEIVSPQFSGGGNIARIVDMDSLEVAVDVKETFINRVYAKQPATVTLNAYPDWQIPAEVIAVIPTADRAKATVKVRIGFKFKDSRIVPDMGAHVSFLESASEPQVEGAMTSRGVMVPPEAIHGNGDAAVAFVIVGDHIERRELRLGAQPPVKSFWPESSRVPVWLSGNSTNFLTG